MEAEGGRFPTLLGGPVLKQSKINAHIIVRLPYFVEQLLQVSITLNFLKIDKDNLYTVSFLSVARKSLLSILA